MAYETGVANGHLDLLYRLRRFLTGCHLIPNSDITYPPGSDAELVELRCTPGITEETITLTCTHDGSAANVVAQTIVNADFATGDLSGWTDGGNTGMAVLPAENWSRGLAFIGGTGVAQADIYQDIALAGITSSVIDAGNALARLRWKGAGRAGVDVGYVQLDFLDNLGTLISSSASPRRASIGVQRLIDEHWHIPLPTGTRNVRLRRYVERIRDDDADADAYSTDYALDVVENPAAFSISGSVSGALGSLFVGEDYSANSLTFYFSGGADGFLAGDTMVFDTVNSPLAVASPSQQWALPATDPVWNCYLSVRGPGLGGTDEIYVNMQATSSPATDAWDWVVYGSTAYRDERDVNTQQNTSPPSAMLLWNDQIPYWLVANGRRIIVIAKISTVFESLYAGFILPYATPTEFPYPFYLGAAHQDTTRWSDTDDDHRAFWDPGDGAAHMRHIDGTWQPIVNSIDGNRSHTSAIWPFARENNLTMGDVSGRNEISQMDIITTAWGGDRPLFPTMLYTDQHAGLIYGELDGVYAIPSFAGVSEDIISQGGMTYLVSQPGFQAPRWGDAAIRLA